MTRLRNHAGCIDTADCYRTINGERYIGWLIYGTEARKSAYRKAGLKFRTINKGEVFLRESDRHIAYDIDRRMDRDGDA